MYLYQIFSFLGTVAVFIAAILFSSKKSIKPKVKILGFISYIGTCIFLGLMGALIPAPIGPDWFMIIQQIFLFFINVRGIKNARIKKKDPFDASIPKDFWDDIMNGEGMEND